ncbi:MAG: hypothetical protein CL927_10520 [Deltaproteobacteria bacterium]|nr:hypothetical protein [Deltaproteobacteria bacterium]HCH62398.1 hypothetical protein [Deltaproteobacteria bacterium]
MSLPVSTLRVAMLCASGLGGCASEPLAPASVQTDRNTYLRALDISTGTSAERFERCRTITDEWMRGDCSLAVAQREASRSVSSAEAWCPHLGESKWLYECYFVAAEAVATVGDAAGARVLCDRSGRNQGSCRFHLYQLEVERAVWSASAHVLEVQAAFDALAQEHARPVEGPGTQTIRQNWYTKVAFRHNITDGSWCQPLGGAHRTDCEQAVWKVLHSVALRDAAAPR